MDLHIYNEAEQFVFDSFNKIGKSSRIRHFERTVHWVKKLKPDADEALLVAAIAHDIERAFLQKDVLEKINSAGSAGTELIRPHEERGAEIIADFLKQRNVDTNFIERVKMLVSRHEEGGNDNQNLLKDADSLSFFETYVSIFVNEKAKLDGKEKVRQQFDWIFNRITSEKAKKIAQPMYEKAISALNANPEI